MLENKSDEIIVTNAGVNGNNTSDLLLRLHSDVLSKHPQLVVLMIGTNDMLSPDNRISLQLYKENYQKLISEIKMHAELVLMTIAPVNAEYVLIRQDPELYDSDGPCGRISSANSTIRQLAVTNNCSLIDIHGILHACGGAGTDHESLIQNEANSGIKDGVHPTANGYRVIGAAVFQAIKLLQPQTKNIVCFGDSITFGYRMEGEGTISGDPYPAVLNRMMITHKV